MVLLMAKGCTYSRGSTVTATESNCSQLCSLNSLKEMLKQPYFYVILIFICLIPILIVGSRYSGVKKVVDWELHLNETKPELQTQQKLQLNGTKPETLTIPEDEPEPELKSEVKVTEPKSKAVDVVDILSFSKTSRYWITLSTQEKLVSVEKQCTNCSKVYFNKTQLEEIHSFLHSCHMDNECKVNEWPTYEIFCLVCNLVVRMRTSTLQFCLDIDNAINSAFINKYVIYPDDLNLLYSAYEYFSEMK